jgi:peptide/nickel transport system ATP-binding protein
MNRAPLLQIEGLSVSYRRAGPAASVLKAVNLAVEPADVMGLVGESGCGKTTVALHILGYRPPHSRVEQGRVLLDGKDMLSLNDRELGLIRGRRVSYVPQNPTTALNPARRVGSVVVELLLKHRIESSRATARRRAEMLLGQVGLPAFGSFLSRYPYQLSGGQQQRVTIAMAIACNPDLVVLDEPTTGLDVSTQRQILDLLESLRKSTGFAMVYVTHDLQLLREIATHVAVMYAGEIVEVGRIDQVYESPRHPYTRGLLRSVPSLRQRGPLRASLRGLLQRELLPVGCAFTPRCDFAVRECALTRQVLKPVEALHFVACQQWRTLPSWTQSADSAPCASAPPQAAPEPALAISGLGVRYEEGSRLSFWPSRGFDAVREFDLVLERGETYALVGESGSGKSTIAKAISGLVAPTAGTILLKGERLAPLARQRTRLQRRQLQMVFQNPDASLNPRHRVAQILTDAVRSFFALEDKVAADRVARALDDVRLPASILRRFPDELSGGERQRVAIGRALIVEPAVLLCDEILSALDVSVQAGIVELLHQLQSKLGLSILFISHDLAVVRALADRIGVIYRGQVVESGTSDATFAAPFHPYTLRLLSAVPGSRLARTAPPADVVRPSHHTPDALCPFLQLCPVQDPTLCRSKPPPRYKLGPEKEILCHHAAATLTARLPALPADVAGAAADFLPSA